MPSQQSSQDSSSATPTSNSSSNEALPYTITRSKSGNNLQVDFVSGPMQSQNLWLNLPELQAGADRDRELSRNQAPVCERYQYKEEDLPETSCHDADGRLISQEEYEAIAARELAEEEERQRRRSAGAQGEARRESDDGEGGGAQRGN